MAFTKSDLVTGEANGIRISSKEYEKLKAKHKTLIGKHTKGRIWVNNGKISKRVYPQEIPNGYVHGRLDKTTKSKVWVNNGIDMRMVYPDQIPIGYKLGMLESVCKDRKEKWFERRCHKE